MTSALAPIQIAVIPIENEQDPAKPDYVTETGERPGKPITQP
jgi:hypothetical protein